MRIYYSNGVKIAIFDENLQKPLIKWGPISECDPIKLQYTSLLSATTRQDIVWAKNFVVWFKPLNAIENPDCVYVTIYMRYSRYTKSFLSLFFYLS